MARYSMTTAQVLARLDNPKRWSMEERRAAIKALQGTVNRAYDRLTKDYGLDTWAIKAIDKKGKVKNWTDLKDLDYRMQMAEIRRAADLAKMKTLSKTGFEDYLKGIQSRVNTGGLTSHKGLYSDLSPAEQTQFWIFYNDITSSADFLASKFAHMDSERLQKYTFSRWSADVTLDELKRALNRSYERDNKAQTPAGVDLDPMDL